VSLLRGTEECDNGECGSGQAVKLTLTKNSFGCSAEIIRLL
jgi:hypothetical protein